MIRYLEQVLANAMQALAPSYLDSVAAEARQLEAFRLCDFSSMATELASVYEFGSNIQIRSFALVQRASKDLAPQYNQGPQRTLRGATEVQSQAFGELYDELGVNSLFLDGEQQAVGQQAHLVGVFLSDDGQRLVPHRIASYEVDEIRFRDQFETDIRNAARVIISLPMVDPVVALRASASQGTLAVKLILTPDQATMRMPNGQELGLLRADGGNPTGRIPLVCTRRVHPLEKSAFLPPIAGDLRSCQIGVNLGVSDVEFIVRHQSHGRMIIQGAAAGVVAKMIPDSPASAWPIPHKDVAVSILQGNPAIDKYLMAIEMTLKLFASYRYLSPDGYRGITGDAKGVDAFAQEEERRRQEGRCQQFEQDFAQLVCDVHNTCLPRAMRMPDKPKLLTRFNYLQPRENSLQEMQSFDIACARGIDSSIEFIQRRESVSEKDAEQLFEKRLERHAAMLQRIRDMGGDPQTAGLDRVAKQVGADNPGGRPTNQELYARDQGGVRAGSSG